MEYQLDYEDHGKVDQNAIIIGEIQRQFHILRLLDHLILFLGSIKETFFCLSLCINPFLTNVLLPDVYRGYRSGTLVENGLSFEFYTRSLRLYNVNKPNWKFSYM